MRAETSTRNDREPLWHMLARWGIGSTRRAQVNPCAVYRVACYAPGPGFTGAGMFPSSGRCLPS